MEIITQKEAETRQVGEILAQEIISAKVGPALGGKDKNQRSHAWLIGLTGDLGSGKTTFIQGLAKGLGLKDKITSPTFVLLKKYPLSPSSSRLKWFYHLDCYRISRPEELADLDLGEIFNDPANLVAVEWAEKIKKLLPLNAWRFNFEYFQKNIGQNKRRITL